MCELQSFLQPQPQPTNYGRVNYRCSLSNMLPMLLMLNCSGQSSFFPVLQSLLAPLFGGKMGSRAVITLLSLTSPLLYDYVTLATAGVGSAFKEVEDKAGNYKSWIVAVCGTKQEDFFRCSTQVQSTDFDAMAVRMVNCSWNNFK